MSCIFVIVKLYCIIDNRLIFNLTCFRDLSQLSRLREEILQCFSSPSEEIKTAAAYAFGSVAIGNLPKFLPALLQEMAQQPKKQYLLLHALKEVLLLMMMMMSCALIHSN